MSEKDEYQARIFANRISKRHRILKKWARKERTTCYRLYDRDIPEVPLAVDLYEFLPEGMDSKSDCAAFLMEENARISANDLSAAREKASRQFLHVYLYERPYEKSDAEEEKWLSLMTAAASETLGIGIDRIVTKTRKKQKGENQYEKTDSARKIGGIVQERGQLFRVNLSDYLDTGLFLDHRPLRSLVRRTCAGKSVLNLFCYTGSFSVYAAEGRARKVVSVDLSNTYISWARFNLALNDFDPDSPKFEFVKEDAAQFLDDAISGGMRFDLIVLDPPTFSNSKSTKNSLDINRDWPTLAKKCLSILNPDGILYFSTNSKKLRFDENSILSFRESAKIEDLTEKSTDEDFRGTKPHRLWKIQVK